MDRWSDISSCKISDNAFSLLRKNSNIKMPHNALKPHAIDAIIRVMKTVTSDACLYMSTYLHFYSVVNFAYSSKVINFSTSPASFTRILAIHPSPSGLLFIVAGFSVSTLFASMIFPATGVKISDADLTDSTAPIASPADTSRSRAGNSTKTTSPRFFAA